MIQNDFSGCEDVISVMQLLQCDTLLLKQYADDVENDADSRIKFHMKLQHCITKACSPNPTAQPFVMELSSPSGVTIFCFSKTQKLKIENFVMHQIIDGEKIMLQRPNTSSMPHPFPLPKVVFAKDAHDFSLFPDQLKRKVVEALTKFNKRKCMSRSPCFLLQLALSSLNTSAKCCVFSL